ncbi:MAG: hypothetical protein K1X72_24700 [Pyrinomonadaceae bacterium]|nr:hypothetical protein [Pyrinomonadaceae bacterium]
MRQKLYFIFASFIIISFVSSCLAQTVYKDTRPNLKVTCSETPLRAGEKTVFTANLKPTSASATYNWTVSAGTITKGQGTPTIEIETLANQEGSLTATVEIGNVYFEIITDSCTVDIIPLPKAKLSAEFPYSTQGYIKMMLDSTIFLELQNDPTAQGHIFIFPKTPREKALIEKIIRNQIKVRGFDATRITFAEGEKNSRSVLQFWIVPAGAEVSIPKLKS